MSYSGTKQDPQWVDKETGASFPRTPSWSGVRLSHISSRQVRYLMSCQRESTSDGVEDGAGRTWRLLHGRLQRCVATWSH